MRTITNTLTIIAVAFGLSLIAGCEDNNNAFEEAGEKVDEAAEETQDAIEDAGEEIEDAVENN